MTERRCDITFPDSYAGLAKRYSATCQSTDTVIEDFRQAQEPNWVSLADKIRSQVLKEYPQVKVYHVYVDYIGRTSKIVRGKDIDRTVYTYKFQVNVEFHDSPIAPLLAAAIILIIAAVIAGFITIITYSVMDVYKTAEQKKLVEAQTAQAAQATGQKILSELGFEPYMEYLKQQTALTAAQKGTPEKTLAEQTMESIIYYAVLGVGLGLAAYLIYLIASRYLKK